jgi:NADPH-dependent curcumin reductase CurA
MVFTQKAWIIDHYAVGELKGTELALVERPVPELGDGQVLIKTLLLTLDPSNRIWLSEEKDYLPQLQIGDVMRGLVIGRVEKSLHKDFKQGDHLFAVLGWQEYAVVDGDELIPSAGAVTFTPHPQIPLDAYVSALGLTGWTAYVGMVNIGQAGVGDKVLVSGAAGATGLLACQIARAAGAEVVGIAGGKEKCDLLVSQFGLAGAIDYKACKDLSKAIEVAFPGGIDVFFDNVGGPMLDSALENMAIGGRLVISGAISQYQNFGDKEKLYGLKNSFMIATKRLRMEGFLILDYLERLNEILPIMERWLLEGSLQYLNSEVKGLENAQAALPRLFSGRHTGKLVVKVC